VTAVTYGHDEPIPDDPAEIHDAIERDVLDLLTEPDSGQPLWSVDDLTREMERRKSSRPCLARTAPG
jgi:hypothetical protein